MRGNRPNERCRRICTFEASTIVDFYRSHLKQVVAIHQAMFQKLLFEEDAAVGAELAELFEDVGKTYLEISERISERSSSLHFIQD
jgi:hypothetical protein